MACNKQNLIEWLMKKRTFIGELYFKSVIIDNGYKEPYFKEYVQKNQKDTLWRSKLKWLPNSTLQTNATYYKKSFL